MSFFMNLMSGLAIAAAATLFVLPGVAGEPASAAVAACCCGKDCDCNECGCADGKCTNCECKACDCTGCSCGEDCGSPCCPTSKKGKDADGCCKKKGGGKKAPARKEACCGAQR